MSKQLHKFKRGYTSIAKRILILLIMFTTISSYAANQESKISVTLENASLSDVLSAIEKQSGYHVYYNNKQNSNVNPITIDVKNKSVSSVLNEILSGTNFTYLFEDNKTIVITEKKQTQPTEQKQKITIRGKVIDADNKAIAGATILVKNSTSGAITDDDGAFVLTLNKGEEVEVTFVGMKSHKQTFSASADNVIIKLSKDALAVDDVVITGIYTRKKESFTGSSQTYKGSDLKLVGTQNLLQSLKSLDPALEIIENNLFGSDPNRLPDMQIRGKSSIAGLKDQFGEDPNQPLFILDGFETTIATINDLSIDRIASVTILKDAASTAIYGAKAANGVVVVETKVPESGKLRFSYNGSAAFQYADLSDYNLMNSTEKLQFELRAGRFESNTPTGQQDLENRYNYLNSEIARGVDTYWLSEPLRMGINHRHVIYVEGGDKQMRYGIGLNYNQNNGVMKNSNRDIVGGNIDLIYRVGKLSFTNKLNFDYKMLQDPIVPFREFSRANPYYRKTNEFGEYEPFLESNAGTNAADYKRILYEVANPMWNYVQSSYDKTKEVIIRDNLNIEYRPLSSLYIRARFGVEKRVGTNEVFRSPEESQFKNVTLNRRGSYDNSRTDGFDYEGDFTITYGALLRDKHQINAVLGAKIVDNSDNSSAYRSEGFPNGGFVNPSFSNQYAMGKPSYSDYKKRGVNLYFNGGYSYDNRYLADFNFRIDGSSVFGADKRFTNTWSVGLAWNIHNEKFMSSSPFQMLKIRGSIGNPGNQNFGSFQTLSSYYFNNWMTNNFGQSIIIDRFGDSDMAWQKTLNTTVGTDIVMINNRLSLTFDYYSKITDPQLASVSIPLSIGTSTRMMAVGKVVTTGFDGSVRYMIIDNLSERINWSVGLSARHLNSYYDNIGESLSAENRNNLRTSLTRYYDGVSNTALWAVRSAGIDPATGREVFVNKDGNYVFDHDYSDEVIVGDTNPSLEGNISTSFRYKGFSLSAYVGYSFGGDAMNQTLYDKVENITTDGLKQNQDRRALYDRWQKAGDVAKYKGINLLEKTPISSRFVMPNNYIAIESVRLGYEFSNELTQKIRISGLSINAYVNDIVRWGTMKTERGIDYPFARSISFSLSFNF